MRRVLSCIQQSDNLHTAHDEFNSKNYCLPRSNRQDLTLVVLPHTKDLSPRQRLHFVNGVHHHGLAE